MKTLSGPGAPPNSTGQRGHRALAASGAPAPRSPAPVRARGARLPLWDPGTLIFVVFALLRPVPTASAMTTGEDRVHQQRAAPQEWKHSLSDRECSPGTVLMEGTRPMPYWRSPSRMASSEADDCDREMRLEL
nr:PREDICTED: tumor necrosis factor receptor superfamily member 10D-like [Rhinolophus sinicus]